MSEEQVIREHENEYEDSVTTEVSTAQTDGHRSASTLILALELNLYVFIYICNS